jgi:hypothetical protein
MSGDEEEGVAMGLTSLSERNRMAMATRSDTGSPLSSSTSRQSPVARKANMAAIPTRSASTISNRCGTHLEPTASQHQHSVCGKSRQRSCQRP